MGQTFFNIIDNLSVLIKADTFSFEGIKADTFS